MTRRPALVAGLILLVLLPGGSSASQPAPSRGAPAPVSVQPTPSATPKPTKGTAKPPRKPGKRAKVGPLNTMRLTGRREVALTFDDGPHPVWTPKVLDELKRANVKATFCVVGVKVRKYQSIMARIVREGHTLCNHSWRHDLKLGGKTPAQIRADLNRTNREILRAVPGARIPYYRQPGGKWTRSVVGAARDLGMKSLHWDVDPADWDDTSTALIRKRVAQQARPGSIVLLHDGGGDRSRTLGACRQMLGSLKQKYGIARLP